MAMTKQKAWYGLVLLFIFTCLACSSGGSTAADTDDSDISLVPDIITGPTPGSCKDMCGLSPDEGDCGCDFHCMTWGDCCPDFPLYCGDITPPSQECSFDVECDTDPPECTEPLVALNKGGCWGCGYPLTCTCSDGTQSDCKQQIPICPEGAEMAVQEGCPICVDPMTCAPQTGVPLEQCTGNEQCVVSEFANAIDGPEDCYCTACPIHPMNKVQHLERKEAWTEHCTAWAENLGCPVTGCAEMGEPSCDDGICSAGTSTPIQCLANPACEQEAPLCTEPMIALQKGGCWGCGNAETCSCADGSALTCDAPEPSCGSDSELAIVNGCHRCVDPLTCEEVVAKPPPQCLVDSDCVWSEYAVIATSAEDCECLGCPSTVLSVAAHESRAEAWTTHCADWAPDSPCEELLCEAPEPLLCVSGNCAVAPPSTVLCPEGDGWYCGDTLNLETDTLYLCMNDQVSVLEVCANGCTVMGAGKPDQCAESPN